MVATLLAWAGEYFSILMMVIAIAVALVNATWRCGSPAGIVPEQLFRWVALLGAGVVGLYTFAGHVFAPQQVAAHIGWPTSPFQYEVGMADLTIGVLGIMVFRRNFGFRLATTVAVTCWLGGDAIGHIRQIVMAHNFAPGNAGPWLRSDILVPVIMVVTLAEVSRSPNPPTIATN